MKIRNGFVSNSSSSSFIVSCKDRTKAKITVSFEVDLAKYGDIIKTVEELEQYYVELYGFDSIEELETDVAAYDEFQKCKRAITKGEIIIMGSFSNEDDDPISQLLCESGIRIYCDEKNVKCIVGDGGF
jgi:hypothetical protein